jgi:hypothetical protein
MRGCERSQRFERTKRDLVLIDSINAFVNLALYCKFDPKVFYIVLVPFFVLLSVLLRVLVESVRLEKSNANVLSHFLMD